MLSIFWLDMNLINKEIIVIMKNSFIPDRAFSIYQKVFSWFDDVVQLNGFDWYYQVIQAYETMLYRLFQVPDELIHNFVHADKQLYQYYRLLRNLVELNWVRKKRISNLVRLVCLLFTWMKTINSWLTKRMMMIT